MKRKSQTAETTMTYKLYCAQLHGEQTKKKLVETGNGWLFMTLNENELMMACIRITHYQCHPLYTNISISDSIVKEIEGLKDMTAAKIWQAVLKKYPKTDLMQKKIYVHWAHLHEATW
ncbi:hypothetical protein L208DRAFT_1411590 [Tricholoma matsutake]|nr:hypothetical protein L208DRAFT_1411590 [Tricholoma matsutake 945]